MSVQPLAQISADKHHPSVSRGEAVARWPCVPAAPKALRVSFGQRRRSRQSAHPASPKQTQAADDQDRTAYTDAARLPTYNWRPTHTASPKPAKYRISNRSGVPPCQCRKAAEALTLCGLCRCVHDALLFVICPHLRDKTGVGLRLPAFLSTSVHLEHGQTVYPTEPRSGFRPYTTDN